MPAPSRRSAAASAALAVAGLVLIDGLGHPDPVQAQVPYKWIGPDGRVNYGDRPPPGARPVKPGTRNEPTQASDTGPPAGSSAAPAAGSAPRATGAASGLQVAGLPYELRLAAQRHPVTLYLTHDCEPCELGRQHLRARGIPFATREVRTQADAAAFARLGFDSLSFPSISVGADRMAGFEAARWDRLLDIAGYPSASRLPASWREPVTEPLGAPQASTVTLPSPGAPTADGATPTSPAPELVPVSPLTGSGPRRPGEGTEPPAAEPPIRF